MKSASTGVAPIRKLSPKQIFLQDKWHRAIDKCTFKPQSGSKKLYFYENIKKL